jgi:hypothetical protein
MQIEAKLTYNRDTVSSSIEYIFNQTKDKAAIIVISWLRQKPQGILREL